MSNKLSAIPSCHLDKFPAFRLIFLHVSDGRTKVRSILLLFKQKMLFLTPISDLSMKFYDKAALRRNIRTKPHIKTCFVLTGFH